MEGFTYRRSSHEPIRNRWTDFGCRPYSVHSVIKSPCPQSRLSKQLPISFGALQSMPLTRARREARLAAPVPLGNGFPRTGAAPLILDEKCRSRLQSDAFKFSR